MAERSSPILLYGTGKRRGAEAPQFVLFAKSIIAPDGPFFKLLNAWHYPNGGKSYRLINKGPP
jgi:hypothetical protein